MIVTHLLALVLGALVALAVLGSALETVVLPQEGFPRLAQFVFALVYRLLVHRRDNPLARSLRRLYAPVALVSLPLAWMIFMMAAFTVIYWGTHDLSWSRAFEISVSSLTTMGFSEPKGPGRIWIAFVEATIGLGLVALLISYLPTIYGAYNGREKGTNRLRPIAGSPPNATDFLQTLVRIGGLETPTSGGTQPTGCSTSSRRTPPSRSSPISPSPTASSRGSPPWAPCSTPSALVFAASDGDFDDVFADAQRGPLTVLVYGLPSHRAHRPGRQHPAAPAGKAPGPPAAPARPPRPSASAGTSTTRPWPRCRESSSLSRARRRRRGAGSPGSAPPTSPLRALAGLTLAAPALWTTDRPAVVGEPRFLRRRPLHIDWSQRRPWPPRRRAPTGG